MPTGRLVREVGLLQPVRARVVGGQLGSSWVNAVARGPPGGVGRDFPQRRGTVTTPGPRARWKNLPRSTERTEEAAATSS